MLYYFQQCINAQLAAQATQAGQQQVQFGQGLLGGALNLQQGGYGAQQAALAPFSTGFTQAANVEQAGMQPLSTGAQLGAGNAAAAEALLRSYSAAAQTDAARNASVVGGFQNLNTGNALSDPIAKLIGKLFGG